MNLPTKTTFTFNHSSQPDVMTPGFVSSATLKADFDSRSQEMLDFVNAIKAAMVTLATVTYYVATTGSDSNNGLTVGTPFLTINKAISLLPQTINHVVTINVAAGTYAETVLLDGFTGSSQINFVFGANFVGALNYILGGMSITNCKCEINPTFFSSTGAVYGVYIYNSTCVTIRGLRTTNVGTYGAYMVNSNVFVNSGEYSNKNYGFFAHQNSKVYSNIVQGSSNTIGLFASGNATIGKNSTQPSGVTAESVTGGGVIR